MAFLIIAFIASLVPSLIIFFFLRKLKDDEEYKKNCGKALGRGLLSVFPVFLGSAVFALIKIFLLKDRLPELWMTAYDDFIKICLVEEAIKFLSYRKLIKDLNGYSRLELIAYMTIVGLGFGLAEDIPYAISSNAGQMLIRGITAMHGGYAFIIGFFDSKALRHKRPLYTWLGLFIAWLLHGAYDFTLSETVGKLSDAIAIIPVTLAFIGLILVVTIFVFMSKARKKEEYTEVFDRVIKSEETVGE